jgi:hypothetical protein
MRSLFPAFAALLLFAGGSLSLHAQSNAVANSMISFLTPAEQEQYAQARAKALAGDPDIKTEGEALMQKGKTVMESGSAADKQAFIEQMNSHRQKLRAAMLKVDPTLEPIFAEIDKHISELKAKRADEIQNAPGASTVPPTSASATGK